jgi:hypothetical protein
MRFCIMNKVSNKDEFRGYWIFTHSERRFCGIRNRHLDRKKSSVAFHKT